MLTWPEKQKKRPRNLEGRAGPKDCYGRCPPAFKLRPSYWTIKRGEHSAGLAPARWQLARAAIYIDGMCGRATYKLIWGFGSGALLASVLGLATSVLAVDSQPRREIVDVQRFPWSSIGKVSSAGEQCTGAVIGADRFLTAAHCLYLTRTGHFLLPESINILLGYEKGEYRAHRVASHYTIPPAFDPSLYAYPPKWTDYLIAAHNDWALVYTDEPFPPDIKLLRLASTKPSPGIAVKMGGYPAEHLYAMTADLHCQITKISHDEKLIAQNCITHSGDSGGPLLSADDDGLILGVQVLAYSLLVQLQEQSKEGGVAVSASSITEFLNPKAGDAGERQ